MKTMSFLTLASLLLACRAADPNAGIASESETEPDPTTSASETTAGTGDTTSASADTTAGIDAEPMLFQCPTPGSLPFETMSDAFENAASNDVVAANPRYKDEASDVLGLPDGLWAATTQSTDGELSTGAFRLDGTKARAPNDMGLNTVPLAGEFMSLWNWDGVEWTALTRVQTDDDGKYSLDGVAPTFSSVQPIYSVLEGDGSCAPHYFFLLPTGTKVVLTDIDGTMTLSDEELFQQIGDGTYDPLQNASASTMMNLWADKGYVIIYLTARPHVFRAETRTWLDVHGFPVGPVISANSLVFDESARTYKRTWVNWIRDDFGWEVVAAYGNATSDIDAYEDAGIPKDITFIVGENAGQGGTTPIADNDFSQHITDFVTPYPDA
jgi:hypothetical protein